MNKLIPVIAILFATSAFAGDDHGAPAQTTEGAAQTAVEAKKAPAKKKVAKKKAAPAAKTEAPATDAPANTTGH